MRTLLAAALAAAFASPASQTPRFVGCASFTSATAKGAVRPASIVVACGDGNFYLDRLVWSAWGTVARGAGIAHQNDCTPYCAAGHFHAYRATVRLDRAKMCAGRPELTRIAWTFVGAKPAHAARSDSETFRCR